MEEYRIVTHFSKDIKDPDPWNAFIFVPEFDGQTSDDYLASNCCALDDMGWLKTGTTEAEAVYKLFKAQERKDPEITDRKDIFERNKQF